MNVEMVFIRIIFSIFKDVSKMLIVNKFDTDCPTCEVIPNENIHYEGHLIRYTDTQCNIDMLQMGEVLLGDLEKVGWVVLKCDYVIVPHSNVQDYFYF